VSEFVQRIKKGDLVYRIQKTENKPKKVALLILGIFSLFLPLLVGGYVETILIFILLYSVVGVGIYLLIGHAGIISLGQVGFYCIGAYVSALISIHYHFSPWIAMSCAAILNGGIAYVLGKPFCRATGMSLAIITLAFSMVVYLAVSRLPFTGGHDGIAGIPRLYIGSLKFSDVLYYYLLWVVGGVVFLFTHNLTQKKIGRGLRALNEFSGGDEVAAITSGIDTTRLKLQVFVIAAVFASVAGSILAHWMRTINPNFFNIVVTFVFVMMVGIGGFRSIWGPLIGAAFYFGMKEVLTLLLGGRGVLGIESVIFALIFIIILLFLPGGITSLPREWREWVHELRLRRDKSATDLS
jgi:branched-chain amino acid transport system permease protein